MSPVTHPDVLVLGAGIVGLAAARELAGRGLAVEVLDRRRPGREASAAAAGMLAPLAEVPEPGPLFDACRAARDLWRPWLDELEDEADRRVDFDDSGALVVARDDEEEAALDALASAAAELGEDAEPMPLDEVHSHVPGLTPDLRRALLLPGDHRVDNPAACDALVRACVARGVTVRDGAAVERVETVDGAVRVTVQEGSSSRLLEAGRLLVAAGAWSGGIEGLPPLPVEPVRGQMLSLAAVDWPWLGVVRAGRRYAVRRAVGNAVPRADGLLVGATVEDAGFHAVNTPAGLEDLVGFVRSLFPTLVDRPVHRVWAGLRPGTPDGLPLLGPWPGAEGVVAATGHYRNGILLAPWTARCVADLMVDGEEVPGGGAFDPSRFGGG